MSKINTHELVNYLKQNNINYLYHANTVATSCTFIEHGGLLSRGTVEKLGLFQTHQKSDYIDKQYKVWNDIFLDTQDLHILFNRNNKYGPVVFKFNIDILNMKDLPPLWITKDNPQYWGGNQNLSERYFQSTEEYLTTNNQYETQRKMLTLKEVLTKIPFFPYLEEIILDNPAVSLKNKGNLFEKAKNELINSLNTNLEFKNKNILKIRNCKNTCYCKSNYLKEVAPTKLKTLFLR